jgi:hypothetical protein
MTSGSVERQRYRIPVFLSRPQPFTEEQGNFLERLSQYLFSRGLAGRTLGVTDYDTDAPLRAIRRLLIESNGLIALAFRRMHIERGTNNRGRTTDAPAPLDDVWLTSPWAHIEPAMAYQLGLPLLILREVGVRPDGMLEPGVAGLYMPEFDPTGDLDEYFDSPEWNDVIWKWESQVRAVVDNKGRPPKLY